MYYHKVLNEIIEIEVLLLVFLVPLLFSSQTSNPVFVKHVVSGFMIFFLLILAALRFYEDRDFSFLKIQSSMPLLMFLILGLASIFYSTFF